MNSNITYCVGQSFRNLSDSECSLARISGLIILCVSLFSILFNVRFIYCSFNNRQIRSHHYALVLSMIFSSILVMAVIVPSIILQNLTCTRLCSRFYCQLEGFVSYLNGCVHMFKLLIVSIIRYGTIIPTNTTAKYLQQHSHVSVIVCWIFALAFALPPLFNWNKYIPEGLGFHCGLNWVDWSISSRLYLILAFSFVYFIPLIVLSMLNIHVYCVIRRLLRQALRINEQSFNKLSKEKGLLARQDSLTPVNSSINSMTTKSNKFVTLKLSKCTISKQIVKFSPIVDPVRIRYSMNLRRLKADRHFALATILLVSEYLLSWTPYAYFALLSLSHARFMTENSYLITISALIAKISMIINPFIYIATIKTKELNIILFWKKCPHHNLKKYKR